MLKKIICILISVYGLILASEKKIGIEKITLEQNKKTLIDYLDTAPLFKNTEYVVDSNEIFIKTDSDNYIKYKNIEISAIKIMFNKKTKIQALHINFPCQTVYDIEKIFYFITNMIGQPDKKTSDDIGFKLETEWEKKHFQALFFCSDIDFEAYFLVGSNKFIREENIRSKKYDSLSK